MYTFGGNVNWYSSMEETVWRFLKKLKIELSYDLVFPLPNKYTKKMKTLIQKDTRHKYELYIYNT